MFNTDPFFQVERQPATTMFNGEVINIGKDVLLNSHNGNVLGVVSPGYKVVTNEEVNDVVNTALAGVPVMKTTDHLNAKTNIWTREIVLDGEEFTHVVNGNDTLKTRVLITNGYGSMTAVNVQLSVWRLVCLNGMMGWKNAFSTSYNHMNATIIELIRRDFNRHSLSLKGNINLWDNWSKIDYKQDQFDDFIDTISVSPDNALISAKQGEGIKALYEPIMNQYNESETLWGAYNVLTAISTHHTKARNGSNIFSAGFNNIKKVTNKFYEEYAQIAA